MVASLSIFIEAPSPQSSPRWEEEANEALRAELS